MYGSTNDGTLVAPFPGSTQLYIMCSKENWERSWYLSSHEHDVILKWQNEEQSIVYCLTNYRLHALWYDSLPPPAKHPFYHLFFSHYQKT